MAGSSNSHSIDMQVDIGNLGLASLSAATNMLAILSADDVSPIAMIQVEALGSFFLVSGPYAAKTSDYLQRCSSTRLERLSIAIGWRKNDAASLMAKSAGGQTAALLCTILFTFYDESTAGIILYDLSSALLPAEKVLASAAQLAVAGKLLHNKMSCLGFGNLIGEQIKKVSKIYELLSSPFPKNLVGILTSNAMVEVLQSISMALRYEGKVVRITGTHGMANIMSIIMMLFPDDSLITVEKMVIFEGRRNSIVLEILGGRHSLSPSKTSVETILRTQDNSNNLKLPFVYHSQIRPKAAGNYAFQWDGWLKGALQLEFARIGVPCSTTLLEAVGHVLLVLTRLANPKASSNGLRNSNQYPFLSFPLQELFGHYSTNAIIKRCNAVLGISLSTAHYNNPHDALSALIGIASRETTSHHLQCKCKQLCEPKIVWDQSRDDKRWYPCPMHHFWSAVRCCINAGFLSLFVETEEHATVDTDSFWRSSSIVGDPYKTNQSSRVMATNFLIDFASTRLSGSDLYGALFYTFSGHNQDSLACGKNGSLFFHSALQSLELCASTMYRLWILADGQIIYNDHYYAILCSKDHDTTLFNTSASIGGGQWIIPSNFGTPEKVLITVRDRANYLSLHIDARVSGQVFRLDLHKCINGYLSARRTLPCGHSSSTPLDVSQLSGYIASSTIIPPKSRKKYKPKQLTIVQTKGDSRAQLFACDYEYKTMILYQCCLSCAIKQLGYPGEDISGPYMIIVS
ncbi:hypothetical protein L228DRAFT_250590 [Xylona heveae TC161]|uniref:Uncharacterized protein n=1 Tax=Xylona heveae (strain CBS 132557 / TC161) TaxID=1328760 RepID=A0A164ZUW5_XYLHT|nr:hypothetical protein L228DRAFT_250590 [Xylona heveae TC161]KZF19561.1 hypothetical protein L228DRAFT_250590 [Xylona heveae TC161]